MTRTALIMYMNREMKARKSCVRFTPDKATVGIRVSQAEDIYISPMYAPKTNEEFALGIQHLMKELLGAEVQWNNDGSILSAWKDGRLAYVEI